MFCSNLRIPKKHSYFHYSSIFESENTQKPFILSLELDSSRQTFRLNMILKCQSLARCNLCNFHFPVFFGGGIQFSAPHILLPNKKKTRSIFSGLWRKSHEHHFLFAFQFPGYFWLWLPETIKVMGTLQINNLSHTVQRREPVHFNSSTATEQAKDEPFYLPKAWGRAGSQAGTFLPVEHTHSPTLNLKAWSNDHPMELIRNTKHKESNLPLTSR